jgi:hypothetical protein
MLKDFEGEDSGPMESGLLCEELAYIGKCFELESIACGIQEEHGCLLADLAFESDVGLDDEFDIGFAKAIGECIPVAHCEDDPEVRDGHVVTIDGVVMSLLARGGLQMRHNLMTEEIEVDPLGRTATLRAAKRGSVEVAGGVEVVDREGDVKRSNHERPNLLSKHHSVSGDSASEPYR